MASIEDLGSAAKWRSVPAFYAASEIPGFTAVEEDGEAALTKGQKNTVRRTFTGIAVGRKMAYIVHHTRAAKTPWGERWELTTIEIVQKALEDANIRPSPDITFQIKDAIVVCGSVYQFEAFYKNMISKISKRWQKDRRVGVPYDNVCLIPLNASGAMQTRYLMLYSPVEMDYLIMISLLKSDTKFEKTNDPLFALNYDGIPVFIAHSLQLQRLANVLEFYNEGMKFYISCYPGQVKYIRRIMPDARFL